MDRTRLPAPALAAALALVLATSPAFAGTIPTYLLTFNAGLDLAGALGNNSIYVFEYGSAQVSRYTLSGIRLSSFGSAGTGNGQFSYVYGMVVDAAGNIYVADTGNNRIQKFNSAGVYLTQWGTTGPGTGQFNFPVGLAVDASGNIYVADSNNERVQEFTNTGTFISTFGSFGIGPGQLYGPWDIGIDAAGNIFVSEYFNNRIQKFSSSGVSLATFGSGGTGPGQFSNATGLTLDGGGNVYAIDYNGSRCEKFSGAGAYLGTFGTPGAGVGQFAQPQDIVGDAQGTLYVINTNDNRVDVFRSITDVPGSYMLTWGSGGSGPGQFNLPYGILSSLWGYVYVCDSGNNRIQFFSDSGTRLGGWGSFGSGTGQFNNPVGVAADLAGNVYVTDAGNNRVQKFDLNGNYVTQWGTLGSGAGQFHQPAGIAVDASGNVYVADELNNRIEKFGSAGAFLGSWGGLGGGNGQLNDPKGVTVDNEGNIVVMDSGNSRLQKFSNSGTYLLQFGSFGTGNGQFNVPVAAAVDASNFLYVTDYNNHRVEKFGPTGTYITQWGALGFFANQFYYPVGISIDPAGSVYVAEYLGTRVQKAAIPATIEAISDVGNDQGRFSRIRFTHCSADAQFSGLPITEYDIYRQIVSGFSAIPAADRGAQPAATQLVGWEQIATIAAHGESEYNVVVPTLQNTTLSAAGLSTFMVRAASGDPYTFYDSGANTGWSIDNLSPPAPAPFTAAAVGGITHLHWGISPASDFAHFNLYRGSAANFVPGPANLVVSTTDTSYAAGPPTGSYYKLSAVDLNGNESSFALVGPQNTLDAPLSDLPREVELAGAQPNPVSPGGMVRYALPRATHVRLRLFDIAGREVRTLEDGARAAGWHSLRWDGRGASGQRLGAGVFFLRLEADGRTLTKRVVALD
jgi:sugar lactone lactonase YvrE